MRVFKHRLGVANALASTGAVTVSGGTLDIGANNETVGAVSLSGGSITGTSGTLTGTSYSVSNVTGTTTISAKLGGSAALSMTGAGTLSLTGANSYSGGTTVTTGTLSIGSDANLGNSSSSLAIGSSGKLQTSASITSSRAVTVNTGGGTFDTNGFDSTLNGNIGGVGALTKTGAGKLTLGGTNTNSGGVSLAAGTLQNNGSLQTGNGDVVNATTGGVTFNNYGTVTSLNSSSGSNQGVDFNSIASGSNTVNNYSTGVIQVTEADAVRPGVNGVVNNDGLIKATTSTGGSKDGIDAQSNTGITIVNAASAGSGTGTGMIEGGRHGITGGNTAADSLGNPTVNNGAYSMSITNNLGGTIQGDNGSGINIDGLNGNEVVTVVNHGTITGNGRSLGDGVAHDGDGVDIDGVVNITNTGTIKSINAYGGAPVNGVQAIEFSEGVTVGGGTITNSGTIQGSIAAGNTTGIGRGITIAGVDKRITSVTEIATAVQAPYAAATITNSGLIKGDSDSGILFSSPFAGGFTNTITNQAGGTIEGGTGVVAVLTGADNDNVINYGTITADDNGRAVDLGAGTNTLTILGGSAVINGSISGGLATAATTSGPDNESVPAYSKNSTLTITPGAGHSFSTGYAISNFDAVKIGASYTDANSTTFTGGTVTLSGTNTYSGSTTLSAGQLNINNASAIGTGTFVINGGAIDNTTGSALTLSTNNALSINSDFEFKGSSDLNLGTGAVTLNANHVVTVDAGKLTIGGTLSSTQYQLTKAGAGTLVLSGTSNFTGPVTVSGGALSTSNVASLGSGTQVNLGSGSALQYTGTTATITQDITVTSGTGTIANTGGGTLTLSGTLHKDGAILTLSGGIINANGSITGSSAGSDLVVDGATVNENAVNDYNGPTYIRNAGTLNANVANALPTANGRTAVIIDDTGSGSSKLTLGADQSAASLSGAASSTVDLGGHTLTVGSSSGTTTYNGVISSSSGGILVKDNGSTLVLTGASTYSGGTQVNAGTLSVTNTSGSATGTGSVIVNSGGTLNGTGTVGSVSVASGGTIAPGLDVGTLNVNGTLDLVSGSHLDYSLGSTSSLLNVSSGLTYTGAGTAIFDIVNTGSMHSNTDYTLINYASESGLSLSKLAFGITPTVFSGHFVIGSHSLTLHVDVVPEPSRVLFGVIGLAFIALRRRRPARKVA